MSVNNTHRLYDLRVPEWNRLRAVLAGEQAVKAAGTVYLPMLEGQSAAEYDGYRARALYFDATARTVDGLTGALFRKPPMVEVTAEFEARLDNVTGQGAPFAAFAKTVAREVIALGTHGVLVDVAPGSNRPYMVGYAAETIRNFRTTVHDGRPALTMMVLAETAERVQPDDPFATEDIEQRRVLELVDGRYTVQLWQRRREPGGREDWAMVGSPIQPTRRGVPLDFIPFQFIGPGGLETGFQRSPVLGLAGVNLSHYRTSADLEHGAHFTALPTLWVAGDVAGAGADGPEMAVGSAVAWQLEPGAQAGILEYRGQGLGALERRLERKEHHMAVLGARLLEDQKAGVEAAATVRLRHAGESSLLAGIADTVGRGLANALAWMQWWAGGESGGVRVSLNKDFTDAPMGAEEMVRLIASWQQGGIGRRALYHNLKQGERLPDAMTFDDWQADIDNGEAEPRVMKAKTEAPDRGPRDNIKN